MQGLNKYTVQEGHNAKIGQNGFDLYYNGATPDNVEGNWIALQANCSAETGIVQVHVECSTGDNLSDNATTGEASIKNGVTVYGPFNKLVSATIGSGEVLIAYRGA
jgi:GTP cyclohydrolase II|tara:strand:+ start:179 stop:496 length:318 start_codon:yes stop_codon:yes gene_type:complete